MDRAARQAAYITLAEVCFQLAFRKVNLSPELGRPDLYAQAAQAARSGGKFLLANAMQSTAAAEYGQGAERLNHIGLAVQAVTEAREELPGWFRIEIAPRANAWLDELDRNLEAGDNPLVAQRILPPFFDALNLPDAESRKNRLAQRAVQILMKNRRYLQALAILESLSETKPKLVAECYEETGQFARAATIYLELGDQEKALKCYRSVPDFAAALALVRKMEGHAARGSLEWLSELDTLLARRPDNFNRTMIPAEKKLLEGMLEQALGVQRKKPAAKKAASKTPQKRTPKKRQPKAPF
jgi:tetratricopeptide (TPR) repeat protein